VERSNYIKVPIIRGFNEISVLYELITPLNGAICGGYARYCASQAKKVVPASDVDIFPLDKVACDAITQQLSLVGFEIKYENDVSKTLRKPKDFNPENPKWKFVPTLQVIKPVIEGAIVTLGSLEEILNNFDFSIARATIVEGEECLVDADFLEDENHRFIRIKNIHCPISSLLRCCKYAKKGYWLSPFEALKLFADWESRDDSYRARISELFVASKMVDSDGNQIKMQQKEIDELEKLLRID